LIELTVSTYGRWLKKKAPGALDRLDFVAELQSGSKVVATGGSAPQPQTAANLQLQEIPKKILVPPTRIERATRGLGIIS
jgi:hypothetical protein